MRSVTELKEKSMEEEKNYVNAHHQRADLSRKKEEIYQEGL